MDIWIYLVGEKGTKFEEDVEFLKKRINEVFKRDIDIEFKNFIIKKKIELDYSKIKGENPEELWLSLMLQLPNEVVNRERVGNFREIVLIKDDKAFEIYVKGSNLFTEEVLKKPITVLGEAVGQPEFVPDHTNNFDHFFINGFWLFAKEKHVQEQLLCVALHELGHCLGVEEDQSRFMFPIFRQKECCCMGRVGEKWPTNYCRNHKFLIQSFWKTKYDRNLKIKYESRFSKD